MKQQEFIEIMDRCPRFRQRTKGRWYENGVTLPIDRAHTRIGYELNDGMEVYFEPESDVQHPERLDAFDLYLYELGDDGLLYLCGLSFDDFDFSDKADSGTLQTECPNCHKTVTIDPEFEEGVAWEMCHYCEKEFEVVDPDYETPEMKADRIRKVYDVVSPVMQAAASLTTKPQLVITLEKGMLQVGSTGLPLLEKLFDIYVLDLDAVNAPGTEHDPDEVESLRALATDIDAMQRLEEYHTLYGG